MFQFFTWRFWTAVIVLFALCGLVLLVADTDSGGDDADDAPQENRRIDLSALVWSAQDDDFSMNEGYSSGYLHLDLDPDGDRTVTIHPGTPGVARCNGYDEPAQCGLLVDVLGDGVVWFALVEVAEGSTIELPPIVQLDDEYAVLSNGWELQYASVLDRRCDTDTRSFSDFQERFGDESTAIIDPGENRITALACRPPNQGGGNG